MSSRVQVFKKNFSVGRNIKIITKTSHEYTGRVVESENDYLLLMDSENNESFIFFEDILSGQIVNAGEVEPVIASSVQRKDTTIETHAPQVQIEHEPEIEPNVLRKLIEVEVRFDKEIEEARIWVALPKLDVPAEELKPYRQKGYASKWESIKNRYSFAVKNDWDRLPGIIADLKDLVDAVPNILPLKRILAYIQYEAEKLQDALKVYKEISLFSQDIDDWYDVAAVACSLSGEESLVCYALNKVFKQVVLTDEPHAWYFYVGLLRASGDYILLEELLKAREMSSEEEELLLETAIYGLKSSEKDVLAQNMIRQWMQGSSGKIVLQNALKHFNQCVSEAYQNVERDFTSLKRSNVGNGQKVSSAVSTLQVSNGQSTASVDGKYSSLKGFIYTYKVSQGYGFLRGSKEGNYFFHRSAVADNELLFYLGKLDEHTLSQTEWIPVTFEIREGPRGPMAVQLRAAGSLSFVASNGILPNEVLVYDTSNPAAYANQKNNYQVNSASADSKTTSPLDETPSQTVDKLFVLAQQLAKEGNYSQAIKQVKRVLDLNPSYSGAQQAYDKWREQARLSLTPNGSTPYRRARNAQFEKKDLEEAVDLYYLAINQNDHKEGAVKDLASVLFRLNRVQESINVLIQYRPQMTNQQAIDSLLIQSYQKIGQYDKANELMKQKEKFTSVKNTHAHLCWQIANNYLRLVDYANAKEWFQRVIDSRIEWRMVGAQMSLALCLIKQQEYNQAEEMLSKIVMLDASADIKAQVTGLLEEVRAVKVTGQSAQIDDIITDTYLTDFSSGISGFTRFFLELCAYEGVSPTRKQEGRLDRSDIKRLEDLADTLGPKRPKDRAEYYLSAAKIASELNDLDDPNLLYQDLCRSFTSRGDTLVLENGHLDAVREWYCEALKMYDGDRSGKKAEPDAACALVRFLYSMLGMRLIPMSRVPYIEETLKEVLELHPETDKVFDAIAYLISRSRYAAKRILSRLYNTPTFQALALTYLTSKGCAIPDQTLTQEAFVQLWDAPLRRSSDETRKAFVELRFIGKVEITVASIEARISALHDIGHHLLFTLDKQRIEQLQTILEAALDLCRQGAFEEQERFGTRVDTLCQELLQKIKTDPTRLSVEGIYPVIEGLLIKAREYLEDIYKSSVPQLKIRLAIESYVPDDNQHISAQIVVENKMGCSPAESLELVVHVEEEFFKTAVSEIKLRESLRGGEQRILKVPLQVSNQALTAQAFSLPIHIQYKTRSGEKGYTSESFAIRLYSIDQVVKIDNPYSAYAAGGTVSNDKMFYGRSELIENISDTIARSEFKSIIIFGQKRTGKSSILYHLKRRLSLMENLLVVDIQSIGSFLDEASKVPMFTRILWTVLQKLRVAIRDEKGEKSQSLHLSFPSYENFCDDPLRLFKDVFEEFKYVILRTEGWGKNRVILLIDEFSYLYGEIIKGNLDENFMKVWKALLEADLFSAVLVGQDVMPKFKKAFPNEFGIVQDVRVDYLATEDAISLIDEPIRIAGRQEPSRYRERAIERILDLTAGSPYYIQMFCNRLVEYMNLNHADLVTDADVNQVRDNLILGGVTPLEEDRFDNLIDSGDTSSDAITREDAKKVLQTIAVNSRTGPCSLSTIVSIEGKTKAPIDEILKDLVDRQVIKCKEGQYYHILVELFKEWLIAHQ